MRALPQALGIIFEMQMKESTEKIARKKKLFNSQNSFFSHFFLFGPLLLSKLLIFSCFVHFKQLKVL
jgi:hypothetical protein